MMINASTAMFPGLPLLDAVRLLHETDISEPLFGPISTRHVQLCPQNATQITEALCDDLLDTYPDTKFRLHANAHVLKNRVIIDASDSIDRAINVEYFQQLALISRRLNAPAYSLHAGYVHNNDMTGMIRNVKFIQQLFGDIPVAVEGLYPLAVKQQLMRSMLEYEMVYEHGLNVALDLSHIKIIAKRGAFSIQMLKDMLESPQTLEVHLSDNDGTRDAHVPLSEEPFWWDTLQSATLHKHTTIFTEGNQRKL